MIFGRMHSPLPPKVFCSGLPPDSNNCLIDSCLLQALVSRLQFVWVFSLPGRGYPSLLWSVFQPPPQLIPPHTSSAFHLLTKFDLPWGTERIVGIVVCELCHSDGAPTSALHAAWYQG